MVALRAGLPVTSKKQHFFLYATNDPIILGMVIEEVRPIFATLNDPFAARGY